MADWPSKKNAAFTVRFPIYDNDGDLVTAAAALDSEVDIDAAGFNDVTAEAIELGTSGVYGLALTAAEMNGDIITTITKTTTTNAKTAVNVMYTATRQLFDLAFPTVSGRSIDVDAGFGVEVGSFQADAITAAAIANGAIDAATFAAGAIDAAAIANGAIDAATFAAGAIDAAAIANAAIDAATFAAGAIDAAAIASNAIDADALAADVTTELRSLVTGTSDAGGSTTTLVDAVLTQADDVFNGAWILFTSGAIANQARLITDFDSVTDTVTFAPAVTASVGAGFTYEILTNAGVDVRSWIGLVTGLVTPNALITGRVDADVGALQANVITAASIATAAIDADAIAADAIGASELAADAVAEIADGVLDEDMTAHQTLGSLGQAIGDPVADATTIYQSVVTDAAGVNVAADIIAIEAQTDDIGVAGAGLTAIPWNAAWDAEVESEVNDAIDTAISELSQAIPTATPTIRTALMLLYMALRNRLDIDTAAASDFKEIYNDAGTVIAKKTLTDDGTVYSEAEMISGP